MINMRKDKIKSSDAEEYLIVDTFERRLKKLDFTIDFAWQLINHIRGGTRIEVPTYNEDQGTLQSLVDSGIFNGLTADQVFMYDTVSGPTYIYSPFQEKWKKLAVWKTKSAYCLEIIES